MSPVRESGDSFGSRESADYLDKLQLIDIRYSNQVTLTKELNRHGVVGGLRILEFTHDTQLQPGQHGLAGL